MKYSIILAGLAIALLSTGCMSPYYAHRERRQVVQEDTLMVPPMTVDDVIAMTKDNVGDDVILAQMKATHTYFRLTSNDIRDLKKSGVSDKVINAMIKSADQPRTSAQTQTQQQQVAYYPYSDYYWYPYPYFYDPWYWNAPVYFGFSYRGGYYGGFGGGFGGGHGGGFRGGRR